MSREGKVLELVGMVRNYPIDVMMESAKENRETVAKMIRIIRARKAENYYLDEEQLEIGEALLEMLEK